MYGRVSSAEPPSCALAKWMLVPGHELAQRGMTHDDLACSVSWTFLDARPHLLHGRPLMLAVSSGVELALGGLCAPTSACKA